MERFSVGALVSISDDTPLVRALCAYEGEFRSMTGVLHKFSAKKLRAIAAATNEHMDGGAQVGFFASEHKCAQEDKSGYVEGVVSVEIITEDNLPDPKMKKLLGKLGLFAPVKLVTEEAFTKFKQKLLKTISIGVDFGGAQFAPNTMFEISGVGVGAIPGAQLFSVDLTMEDFKAMARQALELQGVGQFSGSAPETTEALVSGLYDTFAAFACSCRDPETTDDEVEQIVKDLAIGIASKVQFAAPEGESDDWDDDEEEEAPGDNDNDNNDDNNDDNDDTQEEEDMTLINELQEQVAQLKAQNLFSDRFAIMAAEATKLRDEGKLTPAQFLAYVGDGGGREEAIARFSASRDVNEAIAQVERNIVKLEGVAEGPAIVRFGLMTNGEPLDSDKEASEVESAKAFLDSRPPAQPSYR